jgi:hypothetical protein
MPNPNEQPSKTPWDFNTWGFYCSVCKTFFDLCKDGTVEVCDDGAFFLYHKCGIKAHYIGYVNSDAKPNV